MIFMKIIEVLKNRNRTLLEVYAGTLFWAAAATAAGMLLPLEAWGIPRREYVAGIWTAAVLVGISTLHMQRILERALEFDEGTATKLIFRGYLIRYASFALILMITALKEILNPLVLCLGYLLIMKVAVYSQPFTHKLFNKLFRETDPTPESVEEQI